MGKSGYFVWSKVIESTGSILGSLVSLAPVVKSLPAVDFMHWAPT